MSQEPLPNPTGIDLNDIQGDIILGIPKRFEDFVFFQINSNDVIAFKEALVDLIPLITTTAQVIEHRKCIDEHKASGTEGLIRIAAVNIAFSFTGLQKLGITDSLGDTVFENGQLADAQNLGDPGTTTDGKFDPAWLPAFKEEIDGIIEVCGESKHTVTTTLATVLEILNGSITQILQVNANVRPGKEKGHEHFGFMDGIASPAIASITPPLPGQQVIDPGVLLIGQKGDPVSSRPAWAKNGSFLVYRQLNQLVPEFNKFLHDNPIPVPGLPREQGSELLGARFFGRWKSGAPIDITPTHDDPVLAKDPLRNNDFDFSKVKDQTNCPFAAHIRKTNPRSDLAPADTNVAPHSIKRTSIAFGPEVDLEERVLGQTRHTRGLSFVCYQSDIANGFQFLQTKWSNNVNFPPGKNVPIGFDPIIGQNGDNSRTMAGTDPKAQANELTIPIDFVVPKGGQYFFAPSITALKTKFSVT